MPSDADQPMTDLQEPTDEHTIEVGRTARQGRRRPRRRQRIMMGAVTAGLLVAAVFTLPGLVTRKARPIGAEAVTGADPVISPALFGWLPAGVTNVSYLLHQGMLTVRVEGEDRPNVFAPIIWLSLYHGMPDSGSLGVRHGHYIGAPRVKGRRAFWVSESASDPTNAGDTHLIWQIRGDLWAHLNALYFDQRTMQATVLHIAQQTKVGNAPVALPLTIRRLPRSATVFDFGLWRISPDTNWDVNLIFRIGKNMLTIEVTPVTPTPPPLTAPTKTYSCKNENSLHICVKADVPPTELGAAGISGLLAGITPLGPDPKNWTTNVIKR